MITIDKLDGIISNNLPSIYDLGVHSVPEFLYALAEKLNQVIDNVDYLLGPGLEKEVVEKLNIWLEDGTLANLINVTIFKDLNDKIDNNFNTLNSSLETITNTQEINIKLLGAKGDGVNDDTQYFEKAIQLIGDTWYKHGGGKIIIPSGKYKITRQLSIPDQTIIEGMGKENTVLLPMGVFDCIRVLGNSFTNWKNGIQLKNFTIDGENLQGKGLYLKYMALNSLIQDVNVFRCNGDGIYIEGCFDFVIERVEVRQCKGYGIHVFEQNVFTTNFDETKPFEEVSYITFNNVMCVHNNYGNVDRIQWRFDGTDNMFLNNCKANEGLIGVLLHNGCHKMTINNFYMDGLNGTCSDGTKAQAIKSAHEWVNAITLNNINCWNTAIGLNARRGRDIKINSVKLTPHEVQVEYGVMCWNEFDGLIHSTDVGGISAPYGKNINSIGIVDERNVKIKYIKSSITINAYEGKADKYIEVPNATNVMFAVPQIKGKKYLVKNWDNVWRDVIFNCDTGANGVTLTVQVGGNDALGGNAESFDVDIMILYV